MTVSEIEDKIMAREISIHQVFTQMRQKIPKSESSANEPRIETLLKGMLLALGSGNQDVYWNCFNELLNTHDELIDESSEGGGKYRLLGDKDVIPETAEYLDDDCDTWIPIKLRGLEKAYVGRRFNQAVLKPFRVPLKSKGGQAI